MTDQPYATPEELLAAEQDLARRWRDQYAAALNPNGEPAPDSDEAHLHATLHEVLYEIGLDLQRSVRAYMTRRLRTVLKASFEGHLISTHGDLQLHPIYRVGWRRAGLNLWAPIHNVRFNPQFNPMIVDVIQAYFDTVRRHAHLPPEQIAAQCHAMTARRVAAFIDQGLPEIETDLSHLITQLQEGRKPVTHARS